MISSRTKNKIYAGLSVLAVISAVGSFALAINFLMKINSYVFSVDENIVKEKTTVLDKAGYERIKEKISARESKAEVGVPKVFKEIFPANSAVPEEENLEELIVLPSAAPSAEESENESESSIANP